MLILQKIILLFPLIWIFVFFFQNKINKFLFLCVVDTAIIIALITIKANNLLIILLLMLIINCFLLLLPDENVGFEKKDMLFVVSAIVAVSTVFFIKSKKNILSFEVAMVERLQFVFLFFVFVVVCFFVLKQIFSEMEEKK